MSIWSDNPILHCKIQQPYSVEIWDNILCNNLYNDLVNTFPAHLAKDFNYDGGLKKNLNKTHSELMEFINSSDSWNAFFSTVAEQFFVPHSDFKFEFSMLPCGGGLLPHTDTQRKVQTAVFYFPHSDWKSEYGGEFEIVRSTKNPYDDYSQFDFLDWVDTCKIMSVDYIPNRVILMRRNGHSFHGVRPVKCPNNLMRQSVTVAWLKP